MTKTVYVVIESGCVVDVRSDADVDVVVLDKDTQDEVMLNEVDSEIEKIQNLPEVEVY